MQKNNDPAKWQQSYRVDFYDLKQPIGTAQIAKK